MSLDKTPYIKGSPDGFRASIRKALHAGYKSSYAFREKDDVEFQAGTQTDLGTAYLSGHTQVVPLYDLNQFQRGLPHRAHERQRGYSNQGNNTLAGQAEKLVVVQPRDEVERSAAGVDDPIRECRWRYRRSIVVRIHAQIIGRMAGRVNG